MGNLKWEEIERKNLLHDEGQAYILSAAFATTLEGFGPAPETLYIGLDDREVLESEDTLRSVVPFEPKYRRIPVKTDGDFSIKPERFFQLMTHVEFGAPSDLGIVRNAFLTTAPEGTSGKLILSTALKHPRELFEGDTLIVQMLLDLYRLKK